MNKTAFILLLLSSTCTVNSSSDQTPWPKEVTEVRYLSSGDHTYQPALIYTPSPKYRKSKKRPLLVALHSWSGNYKKGDGSDVYARWCIHNDWYMIHPHFRGPNWTPEALGSDYVIADIVSAVEYMKKTYIIDENKIYLIGYSGGGHAALLMAGRKPEIWAGVSVWCGIYDLRLLWEDGGYLKNSIELVCGGTPDQSSEVASEFIKRSPSTYLHDAKSINLDINHGVRDGRPCCVPFTHSLLAFNKVCLEKDKLGTTFINEFYENMKVPSGVHSESKDPLYGNRAPIFRKISQNARVTIFNGSHEIIHIAALNWLAKQRKDSHALWNIDNPVMNQISR